LAAGCRGGRDSAPMEVIGERGGTGMPGSSGDGTILPGVDVTSTYFNPSKDLQTVYFAYDSASLEAPARAALDDAAKHLRNHPGMLIQIAGHCDERGTQEYNLALGER